ncbi:MAG: hypothetical protein LBN07_00735 [Christensenellaceae bacterium]|jgi:hypothetical protein|nr:hypothetical protein [Christensenellaceae bacterium]
MKALKAISLVLVVLVFVCGVGTATVAYAAERDEIIITPETIIDSTYFNDSNLFSALLSIVNAERILGGETATVSSFRADYFNDKISINLNNEDPSNLIGSYQINAHPNKKISSLDGLNYLFLGALKELKIDNNNLKTVMDSQLSSAANLNKLTLKANRIEEVEIFASNKIYYLDLSENRLKEVDLSLMEKSDGVYYAVNKAYVNLDYNNIESASGIILPNTSYVTADLSLICNNMMTAVPSDFGGHNAVLWVQGYKPTNEVEAGNVLRLVQQGADVLTAKLFYQTGSSFFDSADPNYVVTESDTSGMLTFVPGKLMLKLYENGIEIVTEPFVLRELDIRPAKPSFIVMDLNDSPMGVSGRYGNGIKIISSSSSGATVWAKQRSADDYKVGNEVTLVTTGTYQVSFVAVFDGLTSDETVFNVTLYNAAALTWLLVGVIVLVVIIIAAMLVIRWYRAGGIVAPLSEKERGKIDRPRR